MPSRHIILSPDGSGSCFPIAFAACLPAGGGHGQQQPTLEQYEDFLSSVVQPHLADQQPQQGQQQHSSTSRVLRQVTRARWQAACSSITHLSLSQYQQGRRKAQRLAEATPAPLATFKAVARAAAAPAIPWSLLAATPSLTSLDITGPQVQLLAAGPPHAAARSPLAGLQCLSVTSVQNNTQMWHLGRLLGSCAQLTQLQLNLGSPRPRIVYVDPRRNQPAASEPLTAAALASGMTVAGGRPPLRHLQLAGACRGLADLWLGPPEAASRLTALRLLGGSAVGAGLGALVAEGAGAGGGNVQAPSGAACSHHSAVSAHQAGVHGR
jgi:hypothetical protein